MNIHHICQFSINGTIFFFNELLLYQLVEQLLPPATPPGPPPGLAINAEQRTKDEIAESHSCWMTALSGAMPGKQLNITSTSLHPNTGQSWARRPHIFPHSSVTGIQVISSFSPCEKQCSNLDPCPHYPKCHYSKLRNRESLFSILFVS